MTLRSLDVPICVRWTWRTTLVAFSCFILGIAVSFIYNSHGVKILNVAPGNHFFIHDGLLSGLDYSLNLHRFPLEFQVEFLDSILPKYVYHVLPCMLPFISL